MQSVAQRAVEAAMQLEVKKDGLQQRQNGDWTLRLTVQAADMHARLTAAPMGSRYVAVLVEIDDNEEPKEEPKQIPHTVSPSSSRLETDKPAGRERRRWDELPLPQQAALLCNDQAFWLFLTARGTYKPTTADEAASAIREICGVNSRSHITSNSSSGDTLKHLNNAFRAWLNDVRVSA